MARSRPDPYASMIAGLQGDGLSRAKIAEIAGLSRSTVWRIANGVGKDHLASTLARVESVAAAPKKIPPVKQKRVYMDQQSFSGGLRTRAVPRSQADR